MFKGLSVSKNCLGTEGVPLTAKIVYLTLFVTLNCKNLALFVLGYTKG